MTVTGVNQNPSNERYDGYPSIGCRTCTLRAEPGADPRSGRRARTGRTECGIRA